MTLPSDLLSLEGRHSVGEIDYAAASGARHTGKNQPSEPPIWLGPSQVIYFVVAMAGEAYDAHNQEVQNGNFRLSRDAMTLKFSSVGHSNRRCNWRLHLLHWLRQALAMAVALAFIFAPVVSVSVEAKTANIALEESNTPASGCVLNSAHGNIQHVIYVQFDNVHFTRDNPNVPSDLEQMPNLLNFLTTNGVLMTNHHTPLKSHTADDIITS